MSVLASNRGESKAEFVNTASNIFDETLQFLTKLSTRMSNLLSNKVIELASNLLDECERANSIFPSDEVKKELRLKHFTEARASLMSLDVFLSKCYNVMMKNPQGCFNKPSGNPTSSGEALKKLDTMAVKLGNLIDIENSMLKEIIKSDKNR